MNPLTEMYEQLALSLTADPLLLLASAVAAFDPFWADFDDTDIDYETDPLTIALQVTRSAFPDIYAEAVERLRSGASYAEMDRLLCKAISAKGIPLDDLDTIGWGVPMTAVGVDLEDPEFYAVHTDLLPVLAPFGIDLPEGETYSVDLPECIHKVGCAIAASLHEQTDPALRQVGWLFGWLFSCTGNSLVDYSDEALAEIPPLSCSADDIAFAVELIEEADGIMRDVQIGLAHLKTTPDLMAALERNIAHLYRELKKKGKLDERIIRLEWEGADSRVDGTAVVDTGILQLRRDAA
ncbi:MAG: hypothetical protein IAE80_09180 [Anaerolinea sp.]|nr:hypothetical protein [Anaerolinea sp.]